jgi:hypothetical protein
MRALLVLLALLTAHSAAAQHDFPVVEGLPNLGLTDAVRDPREPPPLPKRTDVVAWELLGTARVDFNEEKGELFPVVPPPVQALNGQKLRVQGFIMPLDASKKQKHIVLSYLPPSCPFCLPGGPETMVEVFLDTPIAYTEDPVVVEGTFEVKPDLDVGVFFTLRKAKPVD